MPADEDPDGDENREGKYRKSVVDAWLKQARTKFGIRSIICLLDQRQLRLYDGLQMDLVSYLARGFHVAHIPVRNYKHPALSGQELEEGLESLQRLEKPILIHCSAGIGRMGTASHVKRKLKVRLKKGFRLQKNVVDWVEVVIIVRQVESSLSVLVFGRCL